MSNTNETIADIIAEMRIFKCRNLETGKLEVCDVIANYLADRLEAALHNSGNAAAMREALEAFNNLFEQGVICISYVNSAEEIKQIKELYRKTKAALSAPPRNCDIGTAANQAVRYMKFCRNYPRCTGCPCVGKMKYNQCEFAWAQIPYEKGGAK